MFSSLKALVCVGGKSTKGESRGKTHVLFGGKQNHTTKCKIIALIESSFSSLEWTSITQSQSGLFWAPMSQTWYHCKQPLIDRDLTVLSQPWL